MKSPLFREASDRAVFLKKNWQVVYAILLIVLIPLSVIANTVFVVNRFRDTVDVQLQRTALMVGRAFTATSADIMSDQAKLQERIVALGAAIPEVKAMDLLVKDGEDFKVVASLNAEAVGQVAHNLQYAIVWYDSSAIAAETLSGHDAVTSTKKLTAEEARSGERYWEVVMPVTGADRQKAYVLSVKLSLSAIDGQVAMNLLWSYIWLMLTILIIILVLLTNTRLFQYAALYRRLQEVDAMKDDFISMASHEMRAPIAAVRGYLSLFLENAFVTIEGKAREAMETTFHISTHLGTLVDDLLDVSRLEQGRMKMELQRMRLEPLIEEIMAQMKFEAEKKNLAFTFTKPATPLPEIMADRSRLNQVLINLVSNAIKYSVAGEVTVTATQKSDKEIEVRVIDTGLGMSAAAREKLFTKFYRVRTDQTSMIPGTGLGLWITKQIVEMMKGHIWCDSIEGVGTQMSIVFPPAPPAPAAPPVTPTAK